MPKPKGDGAASGAKSASQSEPDWLCTVCGLDNWARKRRCRRCDGYKPPPSHLGAAPRRNEKQDGNQTFAEKQLRRALEEQNEKVQKSLAEERRRCEELRRQLQLQARPKQPPPSGDGGADSRGGASHNSDEMDEDEEDGLTKEEIQRQLEGHRKGIEYLTFRHGPDAPEVLREKEEVARLEKAARATKPFKTHRAQLESKRERLHRQQERAQAEEDELLVQVERLQSQINEKRQQMAERKRRIEATDAELKELLLKSLAEDKEGSTANGDSINSASAAFDTVSSTLQSLATVPGVPATFASQLAGMLEQLRVAASMLHQHAQATLPPQAPPQQQSQPQPQQPTLQQTLQKQAAAAAARATNNGTNAGAGAAAAAAAPAAAPAASAAASSSTSTSPSSSSAGTTPQQPAALAPGGGGAAPTATDGPADPANRPPGSDGVDDEELREDAEPTPMEIQEAISHLPPHKRRKAYDHLRGRCQQNEAMDDEAEPRARSRSGTRKGDV